MTLSFWEYKLTTRGGNGTRRGAICLGERIKKGTYRSTITTIPYSQITGALRAALHLPEEQAGQIHAAGKFTNRNLFENHLVTVTMGMRRRFSGTAQIPIDTTVLVDVKGSVFIAINELTKDWDKTRRTIILRMGAYRNKGLGLCRLGFVRRVNCRDQDLKRGRLVTRIPEGKLALFGISQVEKPIYGYLFEPDASYTTGKYVRALFENSIVTAPSFLLQD